MVGFDFEFCWFSFKLCFALIAAEVNFLLFVSSELFLDCCFAGDRTCGSELVFVVLLVAVFLVAVFRLGLRFFRLYRLVFLFCGRRCKGVDRGNREHQ